MSAESKKNIRNFETAEALYRYTQEETGGMTQTKEDIEILWEATRDAKVYVEIGTMYGVSSFIVWAGNPNCSVTTFDIKDYPERVAVHEGTTIRFLKKRSPECSRHWITPIDVLLLDGGHDYLDVLEDFSGWVPHVKEGGSILFHDYSHSSPGVREFCEKFIIGHAGWRIKAVPESIKSAHSSYVWAVREYVS